MLWISLIQQFKMLDHKLCVELIAFTVFLLQSSRARGRITQHAPNLQ